MTPLSQIDNEYSIRLKYFNGYSKKGNIKYSRRKNVTPHQLSRLFSEKKVNWWYDKAEKQDKPFSATKKECFMVTFHKRRIERIKTV